MPCIPYSILPTFWAFSGSLQLPSNLGSISTLTAPPGHRCSCPAYRTAYCPPPEPQRLLAAAAQQSNISNTDRTSGHRCSCPAYRTAYCPRSDPAALQLPNNLGSMAQDDRTDIAVMPCIPYGILPRSDHRRLLAAAQRSGNISTLTAPPDIAAHALHTVRIATPEIQRLRLPSMLGAYSTDAPHPDIMPCIPCSILPTFWTFSGRCGCQPV
jgi:hypothetical protein